ncbi:hypothetical protein JW710_01020 [Candidatus Dojkabacteria bacterium]|nr:hypothetical protein [Candidatus Dojkabacteria bacterium]
MSISIEEQDLFKTLDTFTQIINKNEENFELEIRLGQAKTSGTRKYFETNLPLVLFNRLLKSVEQDKTYTKKFTTTFFEVKRNRIRTRFSPKGDILESVKKKKLKKSGVEISGSNMHIRISISKEIPQPTNSETLPRSATRKDRTTFQYDYCHVDFTLVSRGSKVKRQIEIEIDNTKINENNARKLKLEVLEVTNLLVKNIAT